MPRRPPGLGDLAAPLPDTADEKLKITDTMTLVVAGADGRMLRVKESGLAPGAPGAPSPTGPPITGAGASDPCAAPGGTPGATPISQGSVLGLSTVAGGGGPGDGMASARTGGGEVESVLGKIRFEDLRIGEVIGVGSQGRVRRVQHRETRRLFALKSIAFSEDKAATRAALEQELVRIEALKHPNVVSSYEAYFRDGKLYVLMELLDAGTMMSVLKRRGQLIGDGADATGPPPQAAGLPERRVAQIAVQFLRGLAHLHASSVIHRDIKPANLLCNSRGEVKISDFGVAGDSSKLHMTSVGSTPYMSPERIKSQPYSVACDVWSAGVTLAELAMGQFPFGPIKGQVFELCQLIAGGSAAARWELCAPRTFSPELTDFVARCLEPIESRPTAAALMEHPFLAGVESPTADLGGWFQKPTG